MGFKWPKENIATEPQSITSSKDLFNYFDSFKSGRWAFTKEEQNSFVTVGTGGDYATIDAAILAGKQLILLKDETHVLTARTERFNPDLRTAILPEDPTTTPIIDCTNSAHLSWDFAGFIDSATGDTTAGETLVVLDSGTTTGMTPGLIVEFYGTYNNSKYAVIDSVVDATSFHLTIAADNSQSSAWIDPFRRVDVTLTTTAGSNVAICTDEDLSRFNSYTFASFNSKYKNTAQIIDSTTLLFSSIFETDSTDASISLNWYTERPVFYGFRVIADDTEPFLTGREVQIHNGLYHSLSFTAKSEIYGIHYDEAYNSLYYNCYGDELIREFAYFTVYDVAENCKWFYEAYQGGTKINCLYSLCGTTPPNSYYIFGDSVFINCSADLQYSRFNSVLDQDVNPMNLGTHTISWGAQSITYTSDELDLYANYNNSSYLVDTKKFTDIRFLLPNWTNQVFPIKHKEVFVIFERTAQSPLPIYNSLGTILYTTLYPDQGSVWRLVLNNSNSFATNAEYAYSERISPVPLNKADVYDAIVSETPSFGEYSSIVSAITAGHEKIGVRAGSYTESYLGMKKRIHIEAIDPGEVFVTWTGGTTLSAIEYNSNRYKNLFVYSVDTTNKEFTVSDTTEATVGDYVMIYGNTSASPINVMNGLRKITAIDSTANTISVDDIGYASDVTETFVIGLIQQSKLDIAPIFIMKGINININQSSNSSLFLNTSTIFCKTFEIDNCIIEGPFSGMFSGTMYALNGKISNSKFIQSDSSAVCNMEYITMPIENCHFIAHLSASTNYMPRQNIKNTTFTNFTLRPYNDSALPFDTLREYLNDDYKIANFENCKFENCKMNIVSTLDQLSFSNCSGNLTYSGYTLSTMFINDFSTSCKYMAAGVVNRATKPVMVRTDDELQYLNNYYPNIMLTPDGTYTSLTASRNNWTLDGNGATIIGPISASGNSAPIYDSSTGLGIQVFDSQYIIDIGESATGSEDDLVKLYLIYPKGADDTTTIGFTLEFIVPLKGISGNSIILKESIGINALLDRVKINVPRKNISIKNLNILISNSNYGLSSGIVNGMTVENVTVGCDIVNSLTAFYFVGSYNVRASKLRVKNENGSYASALRTIESNDVIIDDLVCLDGTVKSNINMVSSSGVIINNSKIHGLISSHDSFNIKLTNNSFENSLYISDCQNIKAIGNTIHNTVASGFIDIDNYAREIMVSGTMLSAFEENIYSNTPIQGAVYDSGNIWSGKLIPVSTTAVTVVHMADQTYLVDTTSSACTFTLSTSSSYFKNNKIYIKDNGNASVNNITITPASGTIDGVSSIVIDSDYASITIVSNGTNYFVI